MKYFLSHFRITILFGLVLLLGSGFCSMPIPKAVSDTVATANPLSSLETTTLEAPDTKEPITEWKFDSDLIIWAVNPGYTIDGTRDVGEFIELHRTTDVSLSLAGYSLRYTNTSGAQTTLIDFSEGSSMAGESLLLRLARSPGSDQSDATYMTTLAMSAGKLEIVSGDQVVDEVCWSGKSGCSAAFKSSHPTILLRNPQSNDFSHVTDYTPSFDSEHPSLILPEIPDDTNLGDLLSTSCMRLEFSEILTYYSGEKTEQFIELYNPNDQDVNLSGCQLRYKKKNYPLSGVIAADGYYVFYPNQSTSPFSLTKNPNTSNTVDLVGANANIDTLTYNHGQKKSTSYARFYDVNGEEIWQLTYSPTPGSANVMQEFRACPEGKVINIATGNCVKASSLRTAETDCPAGKYRNPLTGRCKKVSSENGEPKPCAAGYERNPETNRCRKIKQNNNGTDYPLVPETYSDQSTFVALGIITILILSGVVYIILQFRHEIARLQRKCRQRLHHIRKNLVARGISFHRHKKS